MGRSYIAGDNACMESFFALLQKNVLDTQKWQSLAIPLEPPVELLQLTNAGTFGI